MKKIVYIDMDDTLADFMGAYETARERNPAMMFPQAEYGFFANLEPLEGAIESVQRLLDSEYLSPYILTAPSTINPLCYTEKRIWVEQHLGRLHSLRACRRLCLQRLPSCYALTQRVFCHPL